MPRVRSALPAPDERGWLIEELAAVIAAGGAAGTARADVVAVHAGRGVAVANASDAPRAIAFLLALHALGRGLDAAALGALERELAPAAGESFRAALAYLRDHPEAIALLDLPATAAAPADTALVRIAPMLGRYVSPVPARVWPVVVASTALGLGLGGFAVLIAGSVVGAPFLEIAIAVAGVAGVAAGVWSGTRARRRGVVECSGCGERLERGARACASCGGRVKRRAW